MVELSTAVLNLYDWGWLDEKEEFEEYDENLHYWLHQLVTCAGIGCLLYVFFTLTE